MYRASSVISPCIIATYCWHGTTLLVTRKKPRASNCHSFAGNSPLPVSSIRKPSKPAIVWTTLYNVSQIAREFGLDGTNLGRQLRMHYPGVIEWREKVRERLGLGDNLPRGTRPHSKKQYSKAVKLLRSDRYITTQEVADSCGVSYVGLEQHLLFYHKDLIKRRIKICEKAVGQKRKGEITGRGTLHVPSPETKEKYAEAVRLYLYATTPMSVLRIAMMTGISRNRFYDYLHNWHMDLVCRRKNIPLRGGYDY